MEPSVYSGDTSQESPSSKTLIAAKFFTPSPLAPQSKYWHIPMRARPPGLSGVSCSPLELLCECFSVWPLALGF